MILLYETGFCPKLIEITFLPNLDQVHVLLKANVICMYIWYLLYVCFPEYKFDRYGLWKKIIVIYNLCQFHIFKLEKFIHSLHTST